MKHLELEEANIYYGSVVQNRAHSSPAESLEVFSLTDNNEQLQQIQGGSIAVQHQTIAPTIKNWLSYIGSKYPLLEGLSLGLGSIYEVHSTVEDKELVTTSLANALTSMKHLKSYHACIHSNLQPVLGVLKSNDVQLKRFEFVVDGNDSIDTFMAAQTAQSLSSLSTLQIHCTDRTHSLAFIDPLANLCNI